MALQHRSNDPALAIVRAPPSRRAHASPRRVDAWRVPLATLSALWATQDFLLNHGDERDDFWFRLRDKHARPERPAPYAPSAPAMVGGTDWQGGEQGARGAVAYAPAAAAAPPRRDPREELRDPKLRAVLRASAPRLAPDKMQFEVLAGLRAWGCAAPPRPAFDPRCWARPSDRHSPCLAHAHRPR